LVPPASLTYRFIAEKFLRKSGKDQITPEEEPLHKQLHIEEAPKLPEDQSQTENFENFLKKFSSALDLALEYPANNPSNDD